MEIAKGMLFLLMYLSIKVENSKNSLGPSFKTSAFLPNLLTDSSKKLLMVRGRGQNW